MTNTAEVWRACGAAMGRFVHIGVRSLLTAALVLGLVGCVTTKPWHREHLSKQVMNPDPDADREALRSHLIAVREGAVGGMSGGGGGCGCN